MLFRIALAAGALIAASSAFAQTAPNWSYGYVPTAGEVRNAFATKQDRLTFAPVNRAGDTMMGRLQTAASTINGSGFAILPGIAPTSPANGDLWITGAGFFVRVNGRTLTFPNLSSVAITGGTINGTAIGDATPASGSFTTLSASTPVSIASGGTGSATAPAARAALGTAASGANTDITSLNAPALGAATATTATAGTSTTQVATTAFVASAISSIPAATSVPVGQVRLTLTNTTTLTAKPYNGNLIMIGGVYRSVPSAGFTCTNAGQTASTTPYQYAYWTGSAVACEVSTSTHATDVATGVEIKSGDSSRTLIGMAATDASVNFTQAISWFNRRPIRTVLPQGGAATASMAPVAINSTTVLTWGDESVGARLSGYISGSGTGQVVASLALETTANTLASVGPLSVASYTAANLNYPANAEAAATLPEGLRRVQVQGYSSSTSVSFTFNTSLTIETRG